MNHLCAFGAWPTHAILRVGIRGVGYLSHVQGGRDLQTWGWNTAVEHVEYCLSKMNHPKDVPGVPAQKTMLVAGSGWPCLEGNSISHPDQMKKFG